MTSRRYEDACGIARSLDVIGERWALLVVRELVFGPKRFTDLREGLRGISQNVLSQRLRDLEAAGIVRRIVLGPPASTKAYELTALGQALEPVLVAMSRWGALTPVESGLEMSNDAFALALKSLFAPADTESHPFSGRVRVKLVRDAFDIEAEGRRDRRQARQWRRPGARDRGRRVGVARRDVPPTRRSTMPSSMATCASTASGRRRLRSFSASLCLS